MTSLPILLSACCVIAACSSGKKDSRLGNEGQPMSKRIANSMQRMNDPNDRSSFDKAMQASLGKKDGASWFSRQKYGARDYNGVTSFNTTPFKTTEFEGADQSSPLSQKGFAERSKSPAFGDDQFKAGVSPWADQSSRDANRAFDGAGDVFKTKPNSVYSKSAAKDNRPTFIELDEKGRKSAYSEDQVRQLLGRD